MNFLIQAAALYQTSLPAYSSHFVYDFIQLSEKKLIRMYIRSPPETAPSNAKSIPKGSPSAPSPRMPSPNSFPLRNQKRCASDVVYSDIMSKPQKEGTGVYV
jgi:hypothetical protein